jgi:hypothetical protein
MEVMMYLGIGIAAVLLLLLVIGGIVFWRGWVYAARHKDTIVLERIRLRKLLRENEELINRVNNTKIKDEKNG